MGYASHLAYPYLVTFTKSDKRRVITSGALLSLLMNPIFVAPVVALAALLIKPKRPADGAGRRRCEVSMKPRGYLLMEAMLGSAVRGPHADIGDAHAELPPGASVIRSS